MHLYVCVCYLAEGQTVFILVFIFDLKVVQCFALGWSLAQRTQQLDVTSGQETMATVELAMVPVVIHFATQDDDVTLGKLEVTWFFSFVRVEGFTARQRRDILKNMHIHTNTNCTNKTLLFECVKTKGVNISLCSLDGKEQKVVSQSVESNFSLSVFFGLT